MKKINKKLIVSDFDGTLLNSSHTVDEAVINAITEYVDSGGIFAVCTGRMLRSILPRVRGIGLKGLVVAYQGSVIAEIESGKVLYTNGLKAEECVEICTYAERYGFLCNVYADEILYTNVDEKRIEIYETITGVKSQHVSGEMSRFVRDNKLDCNKITFLVYPNDRERLYKLLKNEFDERFDITCSSEHLVEVSPKGDNKGVALEYIANYFNIEMSSTVAIGDNLNDLPMIEKASVGVAVGNAVDELKMAANFVSVTNDEGAVAQIIEKYGFR